MYHRFSSCSWSETWGQRKNCRRCSTPGPCIFIFYCKHASIHSWYIGRQNKALRIIWKRTMIGCMVTCSWCSSGTPCPSAARRRWWGPWGGRSSPPPPSGSRRPGTPRRLCWSARRLGSGGAGWRRRRWRPQQQQPRARGAGAEGTTMPWPRLSKGERKQGGDGRETGWRLMSDPSFLALFSSPRLLPQFLLPVLVARRVVRRRLRTRGCAQLCASLAIIRALWSVAFSFDVIV